MTLLAALIIGVTALSAVSMFTSRITVAVQRQAGEVLAADLVWRSGRPASAELRASAADFNLKTANVSSFPSMAWAGDEGSLAEVRAVDDAYPLRGTILVADKLFGESSATNAVPRSGEAWAEARLLARLGLDIRRLGKTEMREFLRLIGMNIHDEVTERFASPGLRGAVCLDAVLGTHLGPRSP